MASSSPRPSLWHWFDERFDLEGVMAFVRHKEVPLGSHSLFWYFLGGVTLFFFTVQIATGILLLMYYQAGEATSYESMRYVVTKVPFGWLVRSVHCWSAHLMILCLLAHMWSVFFLRAYRKPRELTWFTGIGLFGLTLGFGFSGYLLPWNELAFFATAVGTDSVKSVPVVGEWLLRVLRGGDEVSIRTLYRFFALHVCILPIATFGVVGIHVALIQKQGMARPLPEPGKAPETPHRGMPFFPNFALRDLLLWIVAVNLLALLAVLLPHGPGIPGFEWELGQKADALKPAYPGIKPEWYFLWMYQLLKEFPAHILGMEGPQACLAISTVLMGVWFLVPFVDRPASKDRPSPAFTDFGVAILYFLGYLMLKAWDVGAPPVPHGVDPTGTPVAAHLVARTAALWMLAIGVASFALRRVLFSHRVFWISTLPLIHAVLHGFAGVPYLVAGAISTVLLAVGLGVTWRRARASTAAVLLLVALSYGAPASAEVPAVQGGGASLPESKWPADFTALLKAKEGGKAAVSEKARERFRELPSHAQQLFFEAKKKGLLDAPAQLTALLELAVTDVNIELLAGDNCILCHTNPGFQSDETLFKVRSASDPNRHLDLREVVSDVHLRVGLSCSGCHGGKPTDEGMDDSIAKRWPERSVRKVDRSWIPRFCTDACHSRPEFMRRFNPQLPVDQMLKYRESRHGLAVLGKKNQRAAQCLSCHGTHGIRRPSSPQSLVYPLNVPGTCGKCHANPETMRGVLTDDGRPMPTDQLAKYRKSVHGKALFEKRDLGAPVCNSCHGNHAAMPPAIASVSQICRNCHVNNGKLFDGSPHKVAFEKHGWPECEVCHGKHDIPRPTDAMLGTGPGSVCKDCHAKFGKPSCNETAQHFHDRIVGLELERGAAIAAVDAAEKRGHDLADVRFQLEGVKDALSEARSKIHAFNRAEFDKSAERAAVLVKASRATTDSTVKEYGQRKVGLVVSTLIVTLVAGLLYFKIKEIDRDGKG